MSVYLISQLRVLIDRRNHCTSRPIGTSKPGSGTKGSSGMPQTCESDLKVVGVYSPTVPCRKIN